MMKKLTVLFILLGALAACAPAPVFHSLSACASNPDIRINTNRTPMRATPPNRCAKPGETFKIHIRPKNNEKDTMQIIAKTDNPDGGGPDNWLTKTNSVDADFIEITVPTEAELKELCDFSNTDRNDCEFDYAIFFVGKKPVDPRVTVKE